MVVGVAAADQVHQKESGQDHDKLDKGVPAGVVFIEFGHEVGSGQVNESAGGHGQHIMGEVFDGRPGQKGDCGTEDGRQCGVEIEPQGFTGCKTGMYEDAEVTDLLRNLVQDDGQGGGHADFGTGHPACGNQNAVGEIVQSVGHQTHIAIGAGMVFKVLHIMAMVPVEEFLKDEKGQNARQDQDGNKPMTLDGLKGFGDEVEKDIPHEGAYGQTDQDKDEPLELTRSQGKKKDACDGNKADQQGADQGVDPDMVHILLLDIILTRPMKLQKYPICSNM